MADIGSIQTLESIVKNFVSTLDRIWREHANWSQITKHSKEWWNNDCKSKLEAYQNMRPLLNWKDFRKIVKITKHSFFNNKIQEISFKNKKP